jgi:hypothetical protein
VLVLDALNGKPQAGARVYQVCLGAGVGSNPSNSPATNSEGFADVHSFCENNQSIRIRLIPPKPKEQCGELDPLTFEEISSGVVSKPDAAGGIWCPTKISKKLKPVPGVVVIFVKKPTWWQRHIAG